MLMRGITRVIMHRLLIPRDRYAFNPGVTDPSIQIASSDEASQLLQLNGVTVEGVGSDDEPYTRTCVPIHSAIQCEWKREDSRGSNVYRISDRGRVLTVVSTFHQEKFRVPIVFQATYRRDARTGSN